MLQKVDLEAWFADSRSGFQNLDLDSRIWKPDLQICSFVSPRDLNWSGSYDGATKTWGWGCLMCFTSDPIKIFCNNDWTLLNEKLIDLERICVLLVQRNESQVNTVKIARLCLPPLSQQGWTMFSHCFKWFHMLSYALQCFHDNTILHVLWKDIFSTFFCRPIRQPLPKRKKIPIPKI